MDVFARHRALGVVDQGRDGHLCKTEIVGDARVTSDSGESSKRYFQWFGKLPNALSSPKTYCRHRRCAVVQDTRPQATQWDRWIHPPYCAPTASSSPRCRPPSFRIDHLASPAAGQRKLANDVHGRSVFLVLGAVAEHLTQYSILGLGEPTLSYVILRPTDAMGWIALDDARFDGVGKDATKKTHGARGSSRTAPDDCFAAQLLGLDRNPRLSGHDVPEDLRGCLPGRFYWCLPLSGCRMKECYWAGRSHSMNSTWFIGLRRAPRKMATRRPSVT
jgi:hypothetical protein